MRHPIVQMLDTEELIVGFSGFLCRSDNAGSLAHSARHATWLFIPK